MARSAMSHCAQFFERMAMLLRSGKPIDRRPEAIFLISSPALLKDHSCHLPCTGWRRKIRSGFSFSHFKKESRIGFLAIRFLNFRYSDELNEKKPKSPPFLH